MGYPKLVLRKAAGVRRVCLKRRAKYVMSRVKLYSWEGHEESRKEILSKKNGNKVTGFDRWWI